MNAGKMCSGVKLHGGDACEGGLAYAGAETSAFCLASSLASIEFWFPVAFDSVSVSWKSPPLSGTEGHGFCSHSVGSWLLQHLLAPKNIEQGVHLHCLANKGHRHRVKNEHVFFHLSAKAVSVQSRGAAAGGHLPSSLGHCRGEGEPGAVTCITCSDTYKKSIFQMEIPAEDRHTLPCPCLMSQALLQPEPHLNVPPAGLGREE